MILGAANFLAGVFGVFDELEKGALVGDAIKKEIGRGRRRAKAVRDAESAPNEPEGPGLADDDEPA